MLLKSRLKYWKRFEPPRGARWVKKRCSDVTVTCHVALYICPLYDVSIRWRRCTCSMLRRAPDEPNNKHSRQGSVEMLDWFDYYGHMCIVFEVLGLSVFDFLKDNGFTPFPMAHIQRIGSDLITSLRFLHGKCHQLVLIRLGAGSSKYEVILFGSNIYLLFEIECLI